MMPYGQKVVQDYLRDQLDGVRVVSNPPPEGARDDAWVHVVQIGATHNASDPVDYVIGFYYQFNCYAGADGGVPEAERLSRQVHAAVTAMQGTFDAPTPDDNDVVVSGAAVESGPMSLPDTDGFEPARDRFLLDAVVYAHSVP